jgi:hypothetical protein
MMTPVASASAGVAPSPSNRRTRLSSSRNEDSSIKRSYSNIDFEGLDGGLVAAATLFAGPRSFGFGFSSAEAGLLLEVHHSILVNPSVSHATLTDMVYWSPLSSSRYGPLSGGGGGGENGEVARRQGHREERP